MGVIDCGGGIVGERGETGASKAIIERGQKQVDAIGERQIRKKCVILGV